MFLSFSSLLSSLFSVLSMRISWWIPRLSGPVAPPSLSFLILFFYLHWGVSCLIFFFTLLTF